MTSIASQPPFVNWLIETGWQTALLTCLLALLLAISRNQIPPRWRYPLWLLVVARLLLPELPESSGSAYQILPPSPQVVWEQFTPPPGLPSTPTPEIILPTSPSFPSPVKPLSSPAIASPSFPWMTLLFLTWVSGALVLFLWFFLRQIAFHRRVLRARQSPPPSLQIALSQATLECGLKRIPKLWLIEGIPSPALSGFFSPALLVPPSLETDLSPAQIRMVFLHEIMHWKRRDLWSHLLALIATGIHWCNPLAWWLLKKLRIERELATDAAVLALLSTKEQHTYGETLLHLAKKEPPNHLPLPSLGIFEKHADLKSRLRQIAHFSRSKWGWSLLPILVLFIMLPFFLGQKTHSPEKPTKSEQRHLLPSKEKIKNTPTLFSPSKPSTNPHSNETLRIGPITSTSKFTLFGYPVFEIKTEIHTSQKGDLTTHPSGSLGSSSESKSNAFVAEGVQLLSLASQNQTPDLYRQAENYFTAAIEDDPQNTEAWSRRCEARVGLHDYEGAVSDADNALIQSPNYWHSLMYRGQAYHGLGKYYEAIHDYETILENHPRFFWPPELKAYALLALGQPEAAYQSFSESWNRSDNRPHVKHRMGLTALLEEKPHLAAKNFRELSGLWGRHGESIANYFAGNSDWAERDLSQLCKENPDWMDGAIQLYGIQVSAGKTSAAFVPPETVRHPWQNALLQLGTRSISLENALEAVRDPENSYATLTRQADCYLLAGYQALEDHDKEKALSLFLQSAKNSVMLSHTYLLARHEALKLAPHLSEQPSALMPLLISPQ